jgi:hypothetical protein
LLHSLNSDDERERERQFFDAVIREAETGKEA